MGTLVAEIFQKQLDFEEAIRVPGKDVEPPPRPWTRLREDPKLNAFIGASLEELHQRNLKAGEAKQREEETRKRAAEQGIPVGETRFKAPKGEFKGYGNATDAGHEARKRSAEFQIVLSERRRCKLFG